MSLHSVIKRKVDKTYTGWNYTFDGALRARVKGKDKKTRQRVMRRAVKRETHTDLEDI